jgi:hypothetical protein
MSVLSPKRTDPGREPNPSVVPPVETRSSSARTHRADRGYATRLARAAATRNDITVLPGMEINCLVARHYADAIHVLAIFPPDLGEVTIERIFAGKGLGEPAERTGMEAVRFDDLGSTGSSDRERVRAGLGAVRKDLAQLRTAVRRAQMAGSLDQAHAALDTALAPGAKVTRARARAAGVHEPA